MIRRLLCLLFVFLVLNNYGSTSADVLFLQSPDIDQGFFSDVNNYLATPSNGRPKSFYNADEFVLSFPSKVDSVNWFGFYGRANDVITESDNFTIQFFEDGGGVPVDSPFASYHVGNAVNRMFTGRANFVDQKMFQYSAKIPKTEFAAGVPYYVSIFADTSDYPGFSWAWAASRDRDFKKSHRGDTSPWATLDTFLSLAFSLEGDQLIPEPSTAALLLTCCIVPAVVRRRR